MARFVKTLKINKEKTVKGKDILTPYFSYYASFPYKLSVSGILKEEKAAWLNTLTVGKHEGPPYTLLCSQSVSLHRELCMGATVLMGVCVTSFCIKGI